MIRTARVALVAFALAAEVAAQASLTGEWAMSFTTPRGGRSEYTLYMTQEGPRLTGHLTSEYGETPVKGSVSGDQVPSFCRRHGRRIEVTLQREFERGSRLRG